MQCNSIFLTHVTHVQKTPHISGATHHKNISLSYRMRRFRLFCVKANKGRRHNQKTGKFGTMVPKQMQKTRNQSDHPRLRKRQKTVKKRPNSNVAYF